MANEENRVLGRMGARIITTEEAKAVEGGLATIQICTVVSSSATGTVTGTGDGDGCGDTDLDHPFV